LADTALICRVPEAERYIAKYRERYDPSARRNVPAHVTILYPFMPPERVDSAVLAQLQTSIRGVPRFDYRVDTTGRFPVSLYLAPKPAQGFEALTDAVYRAFPGYPPFGGKFDVLVPHVTVAHADEAQLCEIEVELRIALAGVVLAARCTEVVLIENSRGLWWEPMRVFALGDA
jgi:2'-5' RNA ligase